MPATRRTSRCATCARTWPRSGSTRAIWTRCAPPTATTSGGVTTVRWRQAVDGIPAADSELRVNVTRDGRVLSVLGAPAHDLAAATTPGLTAGEAVRAVQDDTGVYRSLPPDGGARGRDPRDELRRRHDGRARALQRPAGVARDLPRRVGRRLRRAGRRRAAARSCGGRTSSSPTRRRRSGRTTRGRRTAAPRQTVDLSPWLDEQHAAARPERARVLGHRRRRRSGAGARRSCRGMLRLHRVHADGNGCTRSQAVLVDRASRTAGRPTASRTRCRRSISPIASTTTSPPPRSTSPTGASRAPTGCSSRPTTARTHARLRHINNANMYTPPDGTSPVMQMYLWRRPEHTGR